MMTEESAKPLAIDLEDEAIHWDLQDNVTYGDYLDLPRLLDAQKPRSDDHDEMLFIIAHQSSELWMRLSLHELQAAIRHIRADDLQPAQKMFARISRIQAQLIQSWDVLSTLTPSDYNRFRDVLGTGSGFQSAQYRKLEFMLGNKNPSSINVHKHDEAVYADLNAALHSPSLYDEVLRLMDRKGFSIPDEYVERDWSQPYVPSKEVEAQWLKIYHDTSTWWHFYELAEKLVDMEDWFQQWRFRHMQTVERIIGHKRGTGGSSGVGYLRKALDLRFFPELWSVRTQI